MLRTTYYSTRHQTDPSTKEGQSSEFSKGIDESILSITKCLREADIYVATSKSYVEGVRGKLELLKKSMYQADVDLSTAEECIVESEMRIGHLKRELQSLFSKTFYSSPETVPTENVDQSQLDAYQATSEPPNNYSLPSNISAALKKYATSSKINLEHYKTSFEQHGNLSLIIIHARNEEKSQKDTYGFSQTGSFHPETTSKSDNLNNENGIYHKEGLSESNYFQTYNGHSVTNDKEFGQQISEEKGTSFHSKSSMIYDTFSNNQQRIKSDIRDYNSDMKALNDSVVTSGTLDINHETSVKQNTTLDEVPDLQQNQQRIKKNVRDYNLDRIALNDSAVTTGTLDINHNTSVKQNATLDEVPDLVNALSFNSQSIDSRKWSNLDVRLPPRKRYASLTSDVSPIRLSESSGYHQANGPPSKRTSDGSSQSVLVKIDSSESGGSEWESTPRKKEKDTSMPEDKSSKTKNESEDLILLSSSDSPEIPPSKLEEILLSNDKTNANVSIDIKMEAGNGLSFCKDTQTANSFESNDSFESSIGSKFTKNYMKSTLPESNVSYLQSCRPKTLSQSFRERRNREKEATTEFDDSLEEAPLSKITNIRNSEAFGYQKVSHLKIQRQGSEAENITLDALSLTGSIEINDAYTDPLNYYKTPFDLPQSKPFSTPQYRERSKSTGAAKLPISADRNSKVEKNSEMMNNVAFKVNRNSTKQSNDTTYSSDSKPKTRENINTSSSSHYSLDDEFCSLLTKQRFNSRNLFNFSPPEEVFPPLKNTSSFKGQASAKNVASSNNLSMNTASSQRAGNSTANLVTIDDSFSPENANNWVSIQVNTADTSISSESLRTVNETFSKPLLENSYSPDDFSATDKFDDSVPGRESTESYVTVYEAQMPSLSESASNFNCYTSGQLVRRSGLDIISEEYNTPTNIPRIPITACHSRNSLYSYVPKPRASTSSPKPDSLFSEV